MKRLPLLLAAALLGCSADPLTELVVVINSDMAVPAEFDGFRVVVKSHDEEVSTDRHYFVGETSGKVRLPADFGIIPRGGDASRRVTVEVSATTSGAALFSTRAITGFVEGKTLRLDMFLAKRCLWEAAKCESNETCRVEGCVPEEVDPGSLPEFDPDAPLAQPSPTTWLESTASTARDMWLEADVDASGNVYAAGVHFGDVTIDGTTYPTEQGAAMLGSFDSTGKVRWFKSYTANTLAWASSVAVADGRVYASGWFGGQMDVDGELLDSGSGQDAFLACYDDKGQLLWAKSFGGKGNIQAKDVEVAPNGHVGLVGVYPNAQSLGGPDLPAPRGDDVFIARFDSDGNHISSLGFGGVDYGDVGWKVAFDSQSDMLVGGVVSSGTVDFGGEQATFTGQENAFVAKYHPDGTLGWLRTFGNGSVQTLSGVAVGEHDQVAVVGGFAGTIDFGGGVLESVGSADAGVAVFDSDGNHIASTLFGGPGFDRARKVHFGQDALVIVGLHTGDLGFGASTILGAEDQNAFVLALAPDLSAVRWAYTLGGPGDDAAAGLAVAPPAVVVAGEFAQELSYGATSSTSLGDVDGFLLRFVP
jgi:hypothetical protein